MQKHPTHKNAAGFTLIELLIVIAIIAILASVAIPQYSQYKIRGYDAQTKQALKNMHLLCNAYWLDTSALRGCDLPKIEEPTYGFNQNADVVATLPSLPRDNFCASAKHNDSPNTFSIDSASLISSGSDCSGTSGSVQTASTTAPPPIPLGSFATYNATKATEECKSACGQRLGGRGSSCRAGSEKGLFAVVDPDGKVMDLSYGGVVPNNRLHERFPSGRWMREFNCDDAGRECVNCSSRMARYSLDGPDRYGVSHKLVYVGTSGTGESDWDGGANRRKRLGVSYNFETGMWGNRLGEKYKNGKLVE